MYNCKQFQKIFRFYTCTLMSFHVYMHIGSHTHMQKAKRNNIFQEMNKKNK